MTDSPAPHLADPLRAAMRLLEAGDARAAEGALREHLRATPGDVDARVAHGAVLQQLGRSADAAQAYRGALAIDGSHPVAGCNLGAVLRELGELDAAEETLHATLAAHPAFVPALVNLGLTLLELERNDDAAAMLQQAVALQPQAIEGHFGLAQAYSALYRLDEAIAHYRQVLALRPDFVAARWNLSHLLLLEQRFGEGWELFESRWQIEPLKSLRWSGTAPQWLGEELRGKTLYVFSEQGFGDTLQFVRFAPLAAQRGARVILHVQPELVRLVATLPGMVEVDALRTPPPRCDFHCPIMSLPRAFGATLETIPAAIPYFKADAAQAEAWGRRLASASVLRVGIVWSSGIRAYERSIFYAGVSKSMTLAQFGPLAAIPDVVFYSLQKGEPAREASRPPAGMKLVDVSGELRDFADTAALVQALDLVITVDTATAHVAGALGKPVWNLVKYHTCWRWLRGRTDSPWYPTMRLFRQPEAGDWQSVMAEVAVALRSLAAAAKANKVHGRPGFIGRLLGRD